MNPFLSRSGLAVLGFSGLLSWLGCSGVEVASGGSKNWDFHLEGYLNGSFSVPIDIAAGSSGLVVVADVGAARVLAFDEDGDPMWAFGERKGEWQGFGRVSLVDVLPGGEVVAYDSRAQQMVRITATGQFVSILNMPFQTGRIDDLVGLHGGGLAIAGRTSWSGLGADTMAIHVFDAGLRHLRSFGPVPRIDDPVMSLRWGVGSLRRMQSGNLVFGRKIPYEVFTYTPQGEALRYFRAPFELPTAATASQILWGGDSSLAYSGARVEIPSGAIPIGPGLILSQRTQPIEARRIWDLFDVSGHLMQSDTVPADWLFPFAVSPNGYTVYVLARRRDQPAVALVALREIDVGGPQ